MELTLAPSRDRRWTELIAATEHPPLRCLALKLILVRLRLDYKRDPGRLPALVEELRRFFDANRRFAAADYAMLFRDYAA